MSSLSVGDLQPLKEGQKRRQRNRCSGKFLRMLQNKDFFWLIRFLPIGPQMWQQWSGDTYLWKEFHNWDRYAPAHSGVLRASKAVTLERTNRKSILDFISTHIINNKQDNNNDTKSTDNMYTSI